MASPGEGPTYDAIYSTNKLIYNVNITGQYLCHTLLNEDTFVSTPEPKADLELAENVNSFEKKQTEVEMTEMIFTSMSGMM